MTFLVALLVALNRFVSLLEGYRGATDLVDVIRRGKIDVSDFPCRSLVPVWSRCADFHFRMHA